MNDLSLQYTHHTYLGGVDQSQYQQWQPEVLPLFLVINKCTLMITNTLEKIQAKRWNSHLMEWKMLEALIVCKIPSM